MKRNFNEAVKNYDGRPTVRVVVQYDQVTGLPVVDENGNQKFSHYEPMTLRLYAMDAVAGRWRGEENLSIEDMSKRTALLDKLIAADNEAADITTEEGQMILECLRKQGREPYIIGRMKKLLDTDPK